MSVDGEYEYVTSFLRKQKKEKTEQPSSSTFTPSLQNLHEQQSTTTSGSDETSADQKQDLHVEILEPQGEEDIRFERSTLRQSVKRAIGWKKSQRKAVNKRKKENIQNSKLFSKWESADSNIDSNEYYDDKELDVVVVAETDGIHDDPKPQHARSKIPIKRKQSVKRPAVSLKSTAFFSQSVASSASLRRKNSTRSRTPASLKSSSPGSSSVQSPHSIHRSLPQSPLSLKQDTTLPASPPDVLSPLTDTSPHDPTLTTLHTDISPLTAPTMLPATVSYTPAPHAACTRRYRSTSHLTSCTPSRIPRYQPPRGSASTTSLSTPSPGPFQVCSLDFLPDDVLPQDDDEESKRDEGPRTVPARTNKASALREEAAKKKLESTPPQQSIADMSAPRRKSRASFRTKKGIARRPLQKKNIKPAENKASQLRALQHQEDEESSKRDVKPKPEYSDSCHGPKTVTSSQISESSRHSQKSNRSSESRRFSSTGVKTPAPVSDISTDMKTSASDHSIKSTPSEGSGKSAVVPAKPARAVREVGSTGIATPRTNRRIPAASWALHSSDETVKKYAGKTEKTTTVPTNIPKPRVNATNDPTKELVFISLDSTDTLPIENEKPKIDEVRRKRRIQRPVSNIFDGGIPITDPSAEIHRDRRATMDDSECKISSSTHKPSTSISKPSCPTIPHSEPPKPPLKPSESCNLPLKHSEPSKHSEHSKPQKSASASSVPVPESCLKLATRAKPRQVKILNTSSLNRQDSIESPCLSRRRIPVATHRQSDSQHSESSDLEHSCSYDSLHDDQTPPFSPSSPRLRSSSRSTASIPPSAVISTNELENQIQNLRTPPKRSGSISVINIKCRKSWIKTETFLDEESEIEKIKSTLTTEDLILEDMSSGHDDLKQTLTSRTHVVKNVVAALRQSDTDRAARMSISLCFPRSDQPAEEFKTMRRVCQCTVDDLALFQNCLTVLLVDRDRISLAIVSLLLDKIRLTFEILGDTVLRGSVGEMLKFVTANFGDTIAKRNITPAMDYRQQENAEDCAKQLTLIRQHATTLSSGTVSVELMALKKSLELFGF